MEKCQCFVGNKTLKKNQIVTHFELKGSVLEFKIDVVITIRSKIFVKDIFFIFWLTTLARQVSLKSIKKIGFTWTVCGQCGGAYQKIQRRKERKPNFIQNLFFETREFNQSSTCNEALLLVYWDFIMTNYIYLNSGPWLHHPFFTNWFGYSKGETFPEGRFQIYICFSIKILVEKKFLSKLIWNNSIRPNLCENRMNS